MIKSHRGWGRSQKAWLKPATWLPGPVAIVSVLFLLAGSTVGAGQLTEGMDRMRSINDHFSKVAENRDDPVYEEVARSSEFRAWRRKMADELRSEPQGEELYDALLRLQKYLRIVDGRRLRNLRFSVPIPVAAIRACERALDVTLPKAYVDLVTRHGVFKLDPVAEGFEPPATDFSPTIDYPFQLGLYGPDQVASRTLSLRKYMADYPEALPRPLPSDGRIAVEFSFLREVQGHYFGWSDRQSVKLEPVIYKYSEENDEWASTGLTFENFVRHWIRQVMAEPIEE